MMCGMSAAWLFRHSSSNEVCGSLRSVNCECCHPNHSVHLTSIPRPLKRWVMVHFQNNSAVVQLKYELNTDQNHLNQSKTSFSHLRSFDKQYEIIVLPIRVRYRHWNHCLHAADLYLCAQWRKNSHCFDSFTYFIKKNIMIYVHTYKGLRMHYLGY